MALSQIHAYPLNLEAHCALPVSTVTQQRQRHARLSASERQRSLVLKAICTNKHESASRPPDASECEAFQSADDTDGPEAGYIVREAIDSTEYEDAGWLRAIAYYEVVSCCRFFARQILHKMY